MALIEAKGLVKSFGATRAVDNLDLRINAGEIFGLVGSDGAGKTTTLRLLVGALGLDEGGIIICGFSLPGQVSQAREKIGYLSQRFSLYEDLTVLENIRFFAEVRGLDAKQWKPRCLELLEFVGLEKFTDRKAGQLSGGMKQKLGLASALVTQPQVLLLDEPTTGVDPVTRQDFWRLIIRIVEEQGMGVVITTPYMDEAVRCNRLGFMRSGRLIAEGNPSSLRERLEGQIIEIHTDSPIGLIERVLRIPGIEDARAFGERIHVRVAAGQAAAKMRLLSETLAGAAQQAPAIRLIPATLEDVFIALSQEGAHE